MGAPNTDYKKQLLIVEILFVCGFVFFCLFVMPSSAYSPLCLKPDPPKWLALVPTGEKKTTPQQP